MFYLLYLTLFIPYFENSGNSKPGKYIPKKQFPNAANANVEELPLGGIAYGSDCMVVCNDWHSALVPMLIHAEKTTTGYSKKLTFMCCGAVKPLVSVVTLPYRGGKNPSYPFIRPFIGVIIPFVR